jgi:hypothetical protein
MPESFGEHVPPAPAGMIASPWGWFAELDDADNRCNGADEQHNADNRDGQRHDDRGDSHARLLLLEGDARSETYVYVGC